ncbi:MAG: hypothetical protein IJV99_04055 [Clostridia bacterium]|nr:hypothetical protein [Clostridia bacterium]
MIEERFFYVRNQKDVFTAVGEIIKAAQEWEMQYKEYAVKRQIEIENLDYATLRRINKVLFDEGKISEKEYSNLQKVIKLRNYINHDFFLLDFNKEIDFLDEKLNNIMFLIIEATNLVANMIEREAGFDLPRRTVFD